MSHAPLNHDELMALETLIRKQFGYCDNLRLMF